MTPKEARALARRLGGVAEKDDKGHWVILKRPGGNGADIIGWAEDFEIRNDELYHLGSKYLSVMSAR